MKQHKTYIPHSLIIALVILIVCSGCTEGDTDANQPHRASVSASRGIYSVPEGNGTPVLVDGQFTAGEWLDALKIGLEDSVSVYLKEYKGYVFIGVEIPFERVAYIDLFLQIEDNTVYNLHASSQLGQRVLAEGIWPDPLPAIRWGYTDGWYANEVRLDKAEAQRLQAASPDADPMERLKAVTYRYDGFEVQLRRARFTGVRWSLRLEIRPVMSGYGEIVFPNDSKRDITDSWAVFELP